MVKGIFFGSTDFNFQKIEFSGPTKQPHFQKSISESDFHPKQTQSKIFTFYYFSIQTNLTNPPPTAETHLFITDIRKFSNWFLFLLCFSLFPILVFFLFLHFFFICRVFSEFRGKTGNLISLSLIASNSTVFFFFFSFFDSCILRSQTLLLGSIWWIILMYLIHISHNFESKICQFYGFEFKFIFFFFWVPI